MQSDIQVIPMTHPGLFQDISLLNLMKKYIKKDEYRNIDVEEHDSDNDISQISRACSDPLIE